MRNAFNHPCEGSLAAIEPRFLQQPDGAMKRGRVEFTVYQGREGLSRLHDEWKQITHPMKMRRYFHLYPWYQSLLEASEPLGKECLFFLVRQGPEPVAILPLAPGQVRVLGLSFRTLEIPGDDLSDFMIHPDAEGSHILASLIDHLESSGNPAWDLILLPNLLEDSAVMPTFSGFSRLSDDCVLEVSGKCDYLRLETRQPYRMALSRNFRANLRKAENKLARQDRPEFIVASRKEDLLEHFEAFLNVEASGWKGTTGLRTAIQLSPPMLQLFTRLIERFSTDQCCRINLLKLNGETAAGQFCLLSGDTLYILKIGYNEKFSKLSPGNLLLNHVIQDAIQNGVIHDINLVTDTPWHSLWNPLSYTVYRAYLFRKTLRGRLALSLVHLRKRLRAINRRWNVLRREG